MRAFRYTLEEELAIIADYESGMANKELVEKWGICNSLLSKIRIRHNVSRRLTNFQKQIQELRKQGLCSSEIKEITGANIKLINHTAKSIGMPFNEEEKAKSKMLGISNMANSERNDEQYIRERCSQIGVEYIGGYSGSDCFIKVRLSCGHIVSRKWQGIRCILNGRHKELECPECQRIERERKQIELEANREQKRLEEEQQKEADFWKSPFEQRTFSFCKECGTMFYNSTDRKRIYCSSKCSKAVMNRKGKDRRLRKMKGLPNIELKDLYARDKGICWLCGGMCDYEDYTKDEKGSFIAGYNYPSIDHVCPLSKGGQHTWDNVRLAHFYCNTLKSAKVVSA